MKQFKKRNVASVELNRFLGSGEWYIEVNDYNGKLIKNFVSSIGTKNEQHDLLSEYEKWYNSLPE